MELPRIPTGEKWDRPITWCGNLSHWLSTRYLKDVTAHVDSATCGLLPSTIYSEQISLEVLLSHRLVEDFNTEF